MSARTIVAMVLAYLVPGAGHLYLGRRGRGAAFFGIVLFMFVVGLVIDGGVYRFADAQGQLLRLLASLGSMGSGLLYFIGANLGPAGNMKAMTYEYGRTFTLTAGLMNLLLVLDSFDIAEERKK